MHLNDTKINCQLPYLLLLTFSLLLFYFFVGDVLQHKKILKQLLLQLVLCFSFFLLLAAFFAFFLLLNDGFSSNSRLRISKIIFCALVDLQSADFRSIRHKVFLLNSRRLRLRLRLMNDTIWFGTKLFPLFQSMIFSFYQLKKMSNSDKTAVGGNFDFSTANSRW